MTRATEKTEIPEFLSRSMLLTHYVGLMPLAPEGHWWKPCPEHDGWSLEKNEPLHE